MNPDLVIERKRVPVAELKASTTEPGVFEALVSVFGNVDQAGDRVLPGAFAPTLEEHGVPAVDWNHAWSLGPIGATLAAEEREKGLLVRAQLFLDSGDSLVKRIHAGMLADQVNEFSFAYSVADSRSVEEDGADIREIVRFARVYEWGPVVAGMNPDTELVRVAGTANLFVPVAAASRDTGPSIDPVRLAALMAKTRHAGEN